jgi:hypothetical protein
LRACDIVMEYVTGVDHYTGDVDMCWLTLRFSGGPLSGPSAATDC